MDKKNIILHDLTPLGDGSYKTSDGRIVNRKIIQVSQISSNSTSIRIDVNGTHISVNNDYEQVYNSDFYNKTLNKVIENQENKPNWLMEKFHQMISHFTKHIEEKKKKKALELKAKEDRKIAEEKYNNLPIDEKIKTQFVLFRKQVSLLGSMSNETISETYCSIIKSLHTLQEDSLALSQYNHAKLNQEVNSLVFNVLPNIMNVYVKSIGLPNADILSLSAKLDQGLESLSKNIASLKDNHINEEQSASLQALDEAFKFAENRFVETKDEAQQMLELAQAPIKQVHKKTMTM